MSAFIIAYVSLSLLLGLFIFYSVPQTHPIRRALLAIAFMVFVPGLFFGYSDMLGRPKAVAMELLHRGGDARVLSYYLIEDKGIYVWVLMPGASEPRYYVLPWDALKADQLQKAGEVDAQAHGGVMMHLPFDRSLDKNAPMFYPLPQPKLPDKQVRQPPVTIYGH